MNCNNQLVVALGGVAGALARYWVSDTMNKKMSTLVPLPTLIVNLVGCLLIGLVLGSGKNTHELSNVYRLFFVVGFLGAFTTFSTFGYETVVLLQKNAWLPAISNIVISIVAGFLFVWIGMQLRSCLLV